jgi:hypothetical protein
MALDKAGLKSAFQAVFEDLAGGKTAEDAATQLADAIDTYVKTAIATVAIPPGTVVVAAAPIAAPILNAVPISLTGGPATTPPGGLS